MEHGTILGHQNIIYQNEVEPSPFVKVEGELPSNATDNEPPHSPLYRASLQKSSYQATNHPSQKNLWHPNSISQSS